MLADLIVESVTEYVDANTGLRFVPGKMVTRRSDQLSHALRIECVPHDLDGRIHPGGMIMDWINLAIVGVVKAPDQWGDDIREIARDDLGKLEMAENNQGITVVTVQHLYGLRKILSQQTSQVTMEFRYGIFRRIY